MENALSRVSASIPGEEPYLRDQGRDLGLAGHDPRGLTSPKPCF